MNVLVVIIDRLHIGYLGCYGNSWVGTPGFDAWAAGGIVFDQAIVDAPRLDSLYEAYWQGVHALAQPAWRGLHAVRAPPSVLQMVRAASWQTLLVTDEPAVAQHRLAEGFDERHLIAARGTPRRVAGTGVELLFAEAGRQLAQRASPFCMWVHSRGMADVWDAPLARRRQYAEEEDPFPPDFRDVPQLAVPSDFDPDQLQGIRWAYAGQVTLVDDCLAALADLLSETGRAADTAVVIMGARGFLLGEHGFVGTEPALTHEEMIHVPLVMRLPEEDAAAARSQALVQPDDLAPTLVALAGLDPGPLRATGHNLLPLVRGEVSEVRDRAATIGRGDADSESSGLEDQALRTAHWHYRARGGELYVKPDDRWELNEIASRCPDQAAELAAALVDFQRQAATGTLGPLAPLPAGC